MIPTFWSRRHGRIARDQHVYDHPTPVDQDGTLPALLDSLSAVHGLDRVLIPVVTTEPSIDQQAEERVRAILDDFPAIEAVVIGVAEMGSLHRRMEQLEFADLIGGVSLSSYGAVRNVGLLAAAVLGSEAVVFLDDDQIVTDPAFLDTAMEGLGERTENGKVIMAKTGYYTDEAGGYLVRATGSWADRFWRQNDLYDRSLAAIGSGPRIRPTSLAFGGCLALQRDMYCNVPFDPWIARGEDFDYVIDVRMHGGDVFLDTDWSVIHKPPQAPGSARQFRQDVFRFIYEHRKLEFSKSQVDLRQVSAASLAPYPGPFVSASVGWQARVTALLRALANGNERGAYFKVFRDAVPRAAAYARENCERYFAFQRRWPQLMDRLWEDVALESLFTGERRVDRSALTGRFPAIHVDR